MQERKCLPFPGRLTLHAGGTKLTNRNGAEIKLKNGKTSNLVECCGIVPIKVSMSPTESPLEGGCGSFFSGEHSSKTQIDDALSVTYSNPNQYPLIFIADGAFRNCEADHIKQLAHDPAVIKLMEDLREDFIGFYKNGVTDRVFEARAEGRAQGFVTELREIVKKYKTANIVSHFTFSVAIPFTVTIKDQVIRKVVSFGVGNDCIYKISAEDKQITTLKQKQTYCITFTKENKVEKTELIDAAVWNETKKTKELSIFDKTFVPPLSKMEEPTYKLIPVTIVDFKEGDEIFAATDCFAGMVAEYHKMFEEIAKKISEIDSDKKLDKPENDKLLQSLKDLVLTKEAITIRDMITSVDFYHQMHSLFDKVLRLKIQLSSLGVIDKVILGDDLAFCKVKMNLEQNHILCWKTVANHPTTLIQLFTDIPCWNSKKHALTSGVPAGIRCIMEKLTPSSTMHDLEALLQEAAKQRLAKSKDSLPTTHLPNTRDRVTECAYQLGAVMQKDWHTRAEFQELYTDWCKWNQKKFNRTMLDVCEGREKLNMFSSSRESLEVYMDDFIDTYAKEDKQQNHLFNFIEVPFVNVCFESRDTNKVSGPLFKCFDSFKDQCMLAFQLDKDKFTQAFQARLILKSSRLVLASRNVHPKAASHP